jgi:hypothetical protein
MSEELEPCPKCNKEITEFNIKEQIRQILGLNKNVSEDEIIAEITELRNDRDGKMGYARQTLLERLKRDGYVTYDPVKCGWNYYLFEPEILGRR